MPVTQRLLTSKEAGTVYRTRSLDRPIGDSDQLLCDLISDPSNHFEEVDNALTLRPAMRGLSSREQCILHLRFVDKLTQEQIGQQLGVSQIQISRLLTTILATLLQFMRDEQAA